MACRSVPTNQTLSWYRDALEYDGRSNSGEGRDYEIHDLKAMYHIRLNQEADRHYNALMDRVQERAVYQSRERGN